MRRATFLVFGSALLTAITLAGLWSLPLAAASVAFGILYTGGPKPLGYLGLGELLVLIFFGPIAACGTYFLQAGAVTLPVFIASLAPGLLSCSILIANNLRDEISDRAANKKTLVVRWGATFGRWEYMLSMVLAAAVPIILVFFYHAPPLLLTASLILTASWKALRSPALLQTSAILLLIYTTIFCLTLRGFI
jgi:1,4-dihydroxy-2-naphthoate octaprenyltransferase